MGRSIIIKTGNLVVPVYCLEHVLHANKYTTFSEEQFRPGGLIK